MEKLRELNPSLAQFRKLKDLAIKSGIPAENFSLINRPSDVLKLPPYKGTVFPITTFSDLDGVINSPWCGNYWSQVANYHALGKIAQKSTKLVVWSLRIRSQYIDTIPFITNEKLLKIYGFLKKANTHSNIDLRANQEKLISNPDDPRSFAFQAVDELLSDRNLVILGSGIIDRELVKRTIRYSQNINESRSAVENVLGSWAKKHLLGRAAERPIDLTKLYYFDTGHLIF